LSNKNLYIESLRALGGKKNKNNEIDFITSDLLIRHKSTRIEYTVLKAIIKDGKPCVIAYRYYGPKFNKKMHVLITPDEFDSYEPV